MIFYARKIFRKCEGNYSFVVVTDREDLDGQIYRNFLNTGTVRKAEAAQPKDSEQMRTFLGQNKRLVFTLIQKFRWPKGQKYPLLSGRDDIIVIVDEAHRTQYKSLAENMRAGLPKAQYLAFTGTPLLGRDRKTNEWFGDYVSEYNFSQSMDDGATVPLFYKKRVPEMHNQNEDLSEEFYEILEDENLDDAQQEKLEKKFATEMEVIKRDDRLDANGHDLEYNFKDPDDPLQLVFVCAMWLTGFDAPTVSTLYLDKPQRDHTLMQTIARANRVCSHKINGVEKRNGEVVDYYGVFKRLKKAIKDYGEGAEGSDDPPIKDKEELFRLLEEAIAQGKAFCSTKSVHIEKALETEDVFEKVGIFKEWADRLLHKDEWRKNFAVLENTITALYEASKPEILGQPVVRTVAVFQYLRGVIDSIIEQADIDSAVQKVGDLLDESLVVAEGKVKEGKTAFKIEQNGKSWDLSKIDFDKLKDEFKKAEYKNIQIADLRAFLEKKLAEMLNKNRTRRDFAERLQEIIDNYNAGSSSADADFAELVRFAEALREEEERHILKGLTEDDLEIYDLLCKDKMTNEEEKTVRLAAKALLKRLTEKSPKVLVQDWFKDSQTRLAVKDEVGEILNRHLPEEGYNKALFIEKRDKVFELTLDLAINHRKWAA